MVSSARGDDARAGAPISLADGIQDFFSQADPEGRKARRAAQILDAYRRAVILRTWRSNPEAAKLILDHTNAFYVRRDESPRKGPRKDEPYIVCEVCTDDSIVRSEIDLKREMLQLDLAYEGLRFDELRIKPAQFGMKLRHPFSMSLEEIAAFKEGYKSQQSTIPVLKHADDLQTVKRAFCVALGSDAHLIIDRICKIELEVVKFSRTKKSSAAASILQHWLHVWVDDARAIEVIGSYEAQIIRAAYRLGLRIRKIQVHQASPEIAKGKAFPHQGANARTTNTPQADHNPQVIEAVIQDESDRLLGVDPC